MNDEIEKFKDLINSSDLKNLRVAISLTSNGIGFHDKISIILNKILNSSVPEFIGRVKVKVIENPFGFTSVTGESDYTVVVALNNVARYSKVINKNELVEISTSESEIFMLAYDLLFNIFLGKFMDFKNSTLNNSI